MKQDEEEDGVYSTREGDEKCMGDVGKETGRKEITWKNCM